MRIVGGMLKGRPIAAPRSGAMAIRPTTDRARETLFNIIAHRWPDKLEDARVLDLFAGTGALGFEALSRGAAFALFIEPSVEGRALIRKTTHELGVQGSSKLFRRDATRLGPVGTMAPFDLVFADPPYGRGLGEKALEAALEGGWLRQNALVVLEEAANAPILLHNSLVVREQRRTGDTMMHLIEFKEDNG